MAKSEKKQRLQTTVHKLQQRKLVTEQQEPHQKLYLGCSGGVSRFYSPCAKPCNKYNSIVHIRRNGKGL